MVKTKAFLFLKIATQEADQRAQTSVYKRMENVVF